MNKKLVTAYILFSLIVGVFCIFGFTILSVVKEAEGLSVRNPEPIRGCGTISLPVYDNLIFKQRCSACHRVDRKLIGPPLDEIAENRDPEWVFKWLTDKESLYAANDSIAIRLRDDEFNQICVPQRDLSMEDVQGLLNSLKEFH